MSDIKIKKAIKEGRLISFEDILKKYTPERRNEIELRAKYYMARSKLRGLRKMFNLTQQALAKKMKVKREFITRLESGSQNITLQTLIRLGNAVGKEFKFSFE